MRHPFLILSALLCSLTGCSSAQKQSTYESLDVETFSQTIEAPSVVRLDVRTAEEYAEGHIRNAINIDVQKDDFAKLAKARLPKNETVAVYCRSGKRSKKAAGILTGKGFKVIELNTGFIGWTEAGKEVVR